MDAAALGVAHGFAGPVDIGRYGAGEPGNRRALDLLGDGDDGLEIAIGGDGEATWSFSSSVMVAPGDCSPSRRVVSKMKTRSLLVSVAADMSRIPIGRPRGHGSAGRTLCCSACGVIP
jgi:hypothetical protein